jgi:glycogen debranching enzyme
MIAGHLMSAGVQIESFQSVSLWGYTLLAKQRSTPSIGLMTYIAHIFQSLRWARSFASGVLVCLLVFWCAASFAQESKQLPVEESANAALELSRPIRSWEFVSALGTRAGVFGTEAGALEAWVYPLKILRDFHLRFHIDGATLPAETLARTLIVHPESTTIVYAGDDFSVRETLFVPVHEAGAVITFEVDTMRPLEIEALFHRDFQMEWPGTLGDTNEEWDPTLHAFHFEAVTGRFHALVGSPSAIKTSEEYFSNYSHSLQDSFMLGPTQKGTDTKLVVIAASFTGRAALASLYTHLANDHVELQRDSEKYYSDYLARTVNVKLPDVHIQKAYDWARISMLQGVVENPFLGEGLVAGFNASGEDGRPGFAWFFGRDAEWTSLALDAEGDFPTSRTALDFLSKYQRADGKIAHEISQSASFLDWFNATPYAFASADATPLFIVTVNDYVTCSGDLDFARQKWDNLWRAYQFLQTTYDGQGLAQNVGVGHGWIEGGPLYPARIELYQASLGLEAIRALSHLAHLLGKEDLSQQLAQIFERQKPILDKTFWSAEKKLYTYALPLNSRVTKSNEIKSMETTISGTANRLTDPVSVLATVPMWFTQLDSDQARIMIQQLAGPDQQTDWGMRLLSSHDVSYDPGGYHFGVVWPLFTGWASVGEYHYHRALPAYANLRTNALLTLDGSLGHIAEALSGKYYQTLATGSPHQIWSAAMVVSPLLTGLFGLQSDASNCHLDFAPHVPADWDRFSINNVRLGAVALNLNYDKAPGHIRLQVQSVGSQSTDAQPMDANHCSVEFSPGLSLRARIIGVRLDGHATPFHVEANASDQHVNINIPIHGASNTVDIETKNEFELSFPTALPGLGSTSHGLRVLSETWTADRQTLTLRLSGTSGEAYEFSAWNSSQLSSVEGAELEKAGGPRDQVRVQLPASAPGVDPQATVIFHLVAK